MGWIPHRDNTDATEAAGKGTETGRGVHQPMGSEHEIMEGAKVLNNRKSRADQVVWGPTMGLPAVLADGNTWLDGGRWWDSGNPKVYASKKIQGTGLQSSFFIVCSCGCFSVAFSFVFLYPCFPFTRSIANQDFLILSSCSASATFLFFFVFLLMSSFRPCRVFACHSGQQRHDAPALHSPHIQVAMAV